MIKISENFDEKQVFDSYKLSFETLWLTFLLIFINCFIKIWFGPFAEPSVEMGFLISIPITYFAIRSIIKGAYFGKNVKNKTRVFAFLVFTGIVMLISPVIYLAKGGSIIENGLIASPMSLFISAFTLFLIPIAYLIKKITQKNVENEE